MIRNTHKHDMHILSESDLVSIHDTYGARVIRGQYQARKRVILFITVFIISGSFSESTVKTRKFISNVFPQMLYLR